jgi:hypothetical protein
VLKVLIAEDDLMIADMTEGVFVAQGYEVCGIALAKLAEKNCRPTGTTIVGQPDSCSMLAACLSQTQRSRSCRARSRFVYRVAGLLGLCL